MIAPLPLNEAARLAALREYAVMDSELEASYDDVARLAAHICGTKIALISLLDEHRQWFKSHIGLDVRETSRDLAFCAHAIHQTDVMVVNDATRDVRFRDNPLVTGAPDIRFYAGAPLITPAGLPLGTLCVIDQEPRVITKEQMEALSALARQVIALLELRKSARQNRALYENAQRVSRRVAFEAKHDSLTRLGNRAFFSRKLHDSVIAARDGSAKGHSALLYLDLDRFKLINDTMGHAAGDALLQMVARRLKACVRVLPRNVRDAKPDILARLGGDEFTVLLREMESPESAPAVAERIVEALSEPYLIGGQSLVTSASVGIVQLNGSHQCADDAMRDADSAMYEAKRRGKRCFVAFDQDMRSAEDRRLQLEAELRDALAPNGNPLSALHLNYQPIVSLESGSIIGFEALARWMHPLFGMVSPTEFIPIAEECGLINALGDWAITEACAQLRRWIDADPCFARIAVNVNVSRQQLVDNHLLGHVEQALRSARLPSSQLHLEITESSVMADSHSALQTMRGLRDMGVGLYMDDFGTGYSSLSCLHRLPLSGIKIDRSFISTITEKRDDTAVVCAVMNLARNLRMTVVAEGVETVEQVQMLQGLDCWFAQGFYFGRPASPQSITDQVRAKQLHAA